MESSGFQLQGGRSTGSYYDNMGASLQLRARASYDGLKALKEGEAVIAFGDMVMDVGIFYSNPGHAKAMRVTRYVSLPPPDENVIKHSGIIAKVRDLMVNKNWTAMKADVKVDTPPEIDAMAKTVARAKKANRKPIESGMVAVVGVHALNNPIEAAAAGDAAGGGAGAPPLAAQKPQAAPPAPGNPPLVATPRAPVITPPASKVPAATAPPPVQKPVVTTAATPPPTTGAETAAAANPMAFFTKKTTDQPAAPPATPPAGTPPGGPISWDKLATEVGAPAAPPSAPPGAPPATPPAAAAPPATPPASPLDPQSRDIIEKTGKDLGEALFKKKDDDGKGQ
jgi:intracellular multiplication protein IcmO